MESELEGSLEMKKSQIFISGNTAVMRSFHLAHACTRARVHTHTHTHTHTQTHKGGCPPLCESLLRLSYNTAACLEHMEGANQQSS
jgi:hypothetical protein